LTKGQHALRTKTFGLRARAWWVMREQRRFTLPGLLSIVADTRQRDAASNLRKYLGALTRAGILVEDGRDPPTNPTDNGVKRYRLAMNTGPQAPVWRASVRQVYDPNTDQVHSITQEAGHD
jgi:hypothetical protein